MTSAMSNARKCAERALLPPGEYRLCPPQRGFDRKDTAQSCRSGELSFLWVKRNEQPPSAAWSILASSSYGPTPCIGDDVGGCNDESATWT